MDRTKLAVENRKNFPKCYEVIEAFREVFGEVKVLSVKENGRELPAKKMNEGVKAYLESLGAMK